jgi:hypothetical protein
MATVRVESFGDKGPAHQCVLQFVTKDQVQAWQIVNGPVPYEIFLPPGDDEAFKSCIVDNAKGSARVL